MNKYRIAWSLAATTSLFLYYSGIVWLYQFTRRRILKQYKTTILMYHRVRDDGCDPHMSVSPENFEKQIRFVAKNYDVISLSELLRRQELKVANTRDTLVITFDDGFKDNFDNAYPILKKYSTAATIFLIAGAIGKDEMMLNESEIREMQSHLVEFGSHTVTHPILATLPAQVATAEIVDSKRMLQQLLQQEVNLFAYPKGKKNVHYTPAIKSIVQKAGYSAAVCTDNGVVTLESDPFELNRIGIRNFPMFVVKTRISGIFESLPVRFFRNLLGVT